MTFTTPADICPASGGECSVSLTLGFAYGVVEFLSAVVTDPGTSAYAAGDAYPTDTLNDACGDWAAWCGGPAMTEPTVAMAGTTPIGCSCPEYQRRSKAYRWPHPCDHMTAVSRAQPYVAPPDPNRVRTDAAPFYAATYEVTLSGVRYVGDVDDVGRVRLTSVERSGFAADYPLDALSDDALIAARAALASQALAMSARGEVDIFSLPSAFTWRENATSALVHRMSPRDRRAQNELQALRDSEAARAVAIAARCAGSEAVPRYVGETWDEAVQRFNAGTEET